VWFSTSTDLSVDAIRDLNGIGCTLPVIEGVQDLDKGTKGLGLVRSMQRGILFSTYSSLVSSSGTKSRFEQIIQWVGGKDFDGCLIFDECHKAKNFSDKADSGSKVAKAVIKIQNALPRARVVYLSATGVTDISNMAFLDRLGLWGSHSSFKSFEDFKLSMGKRNLGALEMLSMELKLSGLHVSRGLSYRHAEFEILQAALSPEAVLTYKEACGFWLSLKHAFHQALELTNSKSPWNPFWSTHQRFFKQLCVALKVPSVIRETKQALADGHCVIIGLQSTGEAQLDNWVGERRSSKVSTSINTTSNISPVFQLKWSLKQLIDNHFPVFVPPKPTAAGDHSIEAANKFQVIKDELDQIRTLLLTDLQNLELPASAIDDIVYQLGGSAAVAEMTGRKNRCSVSTRCIYENTTIIDCLDRVQVESRIYDNLEEKAMFMEGTKLVAIISEAASTGISLHAEVSAKNNRRRVHITIELPWAADQAVQQLGRSHRSSQVSAPKYKLLTSGIGGENRFVTAVAARLESLGALTHGDRRASSGGINLSEFNFNSAYGRSALAVLYKSSDTSQVAPGVQWEDVVSESNYNSGPGINFWEGKPLESEADFVQCICQCLRFISGNFKSKPAVELMTGTGDLSDNEKREVKRFLNRLLILPIHMQSLLFTYFASTLDAVISSAKAAGTYDEGVSDIHANSIELDCEPVTLFKNSGTGGSLSLSLLRLDRGVSIGHALILLKDALPKFKSSKSEDVLDSEEEDVLSCEEAEFEKDHEEIEMVKHEDDIEIVDIGQNNEHASDNEINQAQNNEHASDIETDQAQKNLPDDSTDHLPDEDIAICDEAQKLRLGGFYVMRKAMSNAAPYILALRKSPKSRMFVIYRPNTGRALLDKSETDLNRAYRKIPVKQAHKHWKALFKRTEYGCIHGECDDADCIIGRRVSKLGIVSGCVVPIWTQLHSILLTPEMDVPKTDRVLRIVRAVCNNGEKVIGLRWPMEAVEELKSRSGALATGVKEITITKQNTVNGNLGFSLLQNKTLINVTSDSGLVDGDEFLSIGGHIVSESMTSAQASELLVSAMIREDRVTLKFKTRHSDDKEEAVTPVCTKAITAATRKAPSISSFFSSKTDATRTPKNNVSVPSNKPKKKQTFISKRAREGAMHSFFNSVQSKKVAMDKPEIIEID